MKMKMLFAFAALAVFVAVPTSAQQFELVSGWAQIGYVPGLIDLNHPTSKELSLGQGVEFNVTLRWPAAGTNPCSVGKGCMAVIGIQHDGDGFMENWSRFTFTAEPDGLVSMRLPSLVPAGLVPCGNQKVYYRIITRPTQSQEEPVPLYTLFVPVHVYAGYCWPTDQHPR